MHIKYAADRTLCPRGRLYVHIYPYLRHINFPQDAKLTREGAHSSDPLKRSLWQLEELNSNIYYMMDNQSSDYPYNYDRLLGLATAAAPLSGLI